MIAKCVQWDVWKSIIAEIYVGQTPLLLQKIWNRQFVQVLQPQL